MSETVSVRVLRNEYARLIARAEAGETVTIVRRGKPVTRLVPVSEPMEAAVDRSCSAAHRRRLPKRLRSATAVQEVVDENRGTY